MTKIIEKMNYALSESSETKAVAEVLLETSTQREIKEMFSFLLKRYKNEPNLLSEFMQSSSDACNIEATECEKIESDFKGYVLEIQRN